MSQPTLRDSRRLPGPNLIMPVAGAVIDVDVAADAAEAVVATWERHARAILDAVGWDAQSTVVRRYGHGVSLALTAPIDALYAATEVNEWAWQATAAEFGADPAPSLDDARARLRRVIDEESNPPLLRLKAAAADHNVSFRSNDDDVSVGMGGGARTWSVRSIPAPGDIDWTSIADIPVALVTGSNGKTTTVRLLDAMIRGAGRVPGISSTDGIYVGGELVDEGDWSGPGGARAVLRDSRVEIAVLETARGGMLRRGLGVDRADAAIVTNVAADHLGEWGVENVDAIAEAKLVVRRALGSDGVLVLNADDEVLVAHAANLDQPVTWFSLNPDHRVLARARDSGLVTYAVRDDVFVRQTGEIDSILPVAEAPITVGGAARHNLYNVLSATALATALGLPDAIIADALRTFAGTPADNPGRGNFFEFDGLRVLVDFAHNPHGMDAMVAMVRDIPAARRIVLIGQAGDRDDESIRAFARSMWQVAPDVVIIKEMRKYLRGREAGTVPDLIAAELRSCGARDDQLEQVASEWRGVRRALELARTGDFVFLPIHADRGHVLELMARLARGAWKPGTPLPPGD